MQLSQALRLRESEIVALVGGGGKTTTMFRLAAEIVAAGGRAVTTTTTRIFAAQARLAPRHFAIEPGAGLPAEFDQALGQYGHVLLTGPLLFEERKASGVEPRIISALQARGLTVIIEADGSRMLPFKAPAEYEPVIPPETSLVVPIVGADVLGQPLDEAHTHRPALILKLASAAGAVQGGPITPEVVAAVLSHPQGGLKGVPTGARAIPLINKAGLASRLPEARCAADLLLESPSLDAALLGQAAEREPVIEAWSRVAVVILAAGGSSRMGRPKQLLPWRDTTLIGAAARSALASRAREVLVVVGAEGDRVAQALAGLPVRIVRNERWAAGQSTSMQAGLTALAPRFDAAVFMLGDQPFVTAGLVDALIQRHRETLAPIVAPRVNGRRANPVLFDRVLWRELAQASGDAGGRGLFDTHADEAAWVDWDEGITADVDTPEDYQALSPEGET